MVFVLCTVTFFGCGNRVDIDEHEWHLQVAHRLNTATQTQTLLARHENWTTEDDTVPVVDVVLVAQNGKITITDKGTDKTYTGTYQKTQSGVGESVYELTVEGLSGHGTVAFTTYADGAKTPTFPFALIEGDMQYSLHFQAE